MAVKGSTVADYLSVLPADRSEPLSTVRQLILTNLPPGYEEGIQYGMIGYFVPHRIFPPGYHCDPKQPLPFASIASQKNHMAIYLCSLYSNCDDGLAAFREAWAKTGKKLDMGKSCIRFKKVDDLALDVIAEAIRAMPVERFLAQYEVVDPRQKKAAKAASKQR